MAKNIDPVTLKLTEGAEAIALDVTARLKTFLGEWFLDTTIGIPYYDVIFAKGTTDETIRAILASAVLATPGIEELLSFTFDRAQSRVNFVSSTAQGEVIL